MPIQDRNKLKSWFVTGAYPTQNQFWDFLDSYLHKSEDKISIDTVASLRDLLNQKADQATYSALYNLYQQLSANALLKDTQFTGEVTGKYNDLKLGNGAVIAKVLEGLEIPATPEAINVTDTILSAFAKLQSQLHRVPVLDENDKIPVENLPAEADPFFLSSPAASITAMNIQSWNNKEDKDNKVDNFNSPNDITYPTTLAVQTAIDAQKIAYEQGTWTPVPPNSDWTVDVTGTARFARYIRLGNLVTLYLDTVITYRGSSSNPLTNGYLLRLSGLPFIAVAYNATIHDIASGRINRGIGIAASGAGYFDIYDTSFTLSGNLIRATITYPINI